MTVLSRRFASGLVSALPVLSAAVAFASGCWTTPSDDGSPTTPAPTTTPPPEEPTVVADVRPPAISGGTMIVSRDGKRAFISDPDRDRFVDFDLATKQVHGVVELARGDEPGRLIEDADGFVHVATRRTGDVVTIDPATDTIVGRRSVCAAPRGIAYEPLHDRLHVACVGGELVSLGAGAGQPIVRTLRLEGDLRDVVAQGDRLFVSRFRSADVLVLDADGNVIHRAHPLGMFDSTSQQPLAPAVAWRTVALPGGGVISVHQRSMSAVLPGGAPNGSSSASGGEEAPPPYYGPSCWDAVVQPSATLYDADGNVLSGTGGGRLANLVLPVDIAVSKDGARTAVVSAATNAVVDAPTSSFATADWCGHGAPVSFRSMAVPGEPISTAYALDGTLLVLAREPSALYLVPPDQMTPSGVPLGGESRADTGHKLFHGNPDGIAGIACASCHPEGRDDGRVYVFPNEGPRRSISVSGAILQTAPFHWSGDLPSMDDVMNEVFVKRMGGQPQTLERMGAIATYVDQLPDVARSTPADGDAVSRGAAIFQNPDVGCTSCHDGPRMTNSTTVDVGTGGAFQVPSLVGLSRGGPYMHNGCAATLRDRFTTPCGGGDQHGHTSALSPAQIDDLVAYLESL